MMSHSNKAAPAERLLKRGEAARQLAISERKLFSLTRQGAVRCVRIGRCVRYRPVDLQRFMDGLES